MNHLVWRVHLFNVPFLKGANGQEQVRFRSSKVAALLAYLAIHLGRPCSREAIYEALWPDEIGKKLSPFVYE